VLNAGRRLLIGPGTGNQQAKISNDLRMRAPADSEKLRHPLPHEVHGSGAK